MVESKVTLALLFAVAVESATVCVWAGVATQRLKDVERRVAEQAEVVDRLTRVEVHLEMAANQMARIERKLEGE